MLQLDASGIVGTAPALSLVDPGSVNFDNVILSLSGASFPGGEATASVSPVAGAQAWEDAINSLHPNLAVSVQERSIDQRIEANSRHINFLQSSDLYSCSDRLFKINWNAAVLVDGTSVDGDTFAVRSAGSSIKATVVASSTGVVSLEAAKHQAGTLFYRRSGVPTVTARDASDALVACANTASGCSLELPALVRDLPGRLVAAEVQRVQGLELPEPFRDLPGRLARLHDGDWQEQWPLLGACSLLVSIDDIGDGPCGLDAPAAIRASILLAIVGPQ